LVRKILPDKPHIEEHQNEYERAAIKELVSLDHHITPHHHNSITTYNILINCVVSSQRFNYHSHYPYDRV
jgi:hypothetical protein